MSTKRRGAKLLSILMIAAMLLTYNSSIPMAVWAANEAETEVSEEQQTPETGAAAEEATDPAESQAGANDSDLEEENADNAYEEKGEGAEKSEAAEAKTDAEAAEEEKDAGPADKKTEYVYSDKQIKVTATLSDPSAVPDEAELVVTPVTKDTDGYNYDAYMAALNKGSEESSYTDENTLLYDIAFIVNEDGKKTEVQPEEGKVSIKAEFLKKQLTESIGAEKADEVKLVHLPLSDEIAGSIDTTAAATDIKASDIKVENVDADVTVGKKQEATFKTDSLSVWAFADGSGYMTVPAPSPAKFEDSTKYNLLGGDFGILSNFGLVSFDTLTLDQHACSNFAAENVVLKAKAEGVGTNNHGGKSPEASYIGSSIVNNGLVKDFAVNLEGDSILVLGKDIPAGTVDNGSNVETWNCTIEDIPTAISHAKKYVEKDGEKVSASVFQETDTKYIDLPALKTKAENMSTDFAGFETSNVIRKEDTSFLHYDETKNTTVAALNLKASELSKPLKLEDANANNSHVLIINIDAEGANEINFPGLTWVKADGTAQTGTTGEVSVWTDGNVIINVIDSTKANKRFTGTFHNNNDQTTAMILAPDATVTAAKNINGQVIANNIAISGDGEFHRDSFTFKSSITVRGGIKARKAVNGSSDLSNVTQRFSFQLTAIEGKDLKGNIIPKANMPMPDNATAAEKKSKSMIADSDMNGVINFGFIDFDGVEGDYTFSVKEIIPAGAVETDGGKYSNGYIYDTNEYTVTIKGRTTADGGIGIEGYDISRNGGEPEYIDYNTGKQNGIVTFNNREASNKAPVKVTKAFNGEWPEEGFTFKLTGISVEENGTVTDWQDWMSLPSDLDYDPGKEKSVTVTKDSPVADFGVMKFNSGENKKYTLQIQEIVDKPIDGVIYDNSIHTVVIESKKIGNDTVALTTYDGSKSTLTITNTEIGKLVIEKSFDGLNVTDEEKAGGLTFEVKTPDGKWLDKDGKVSEKKVTLTLKDGGFNKVGGKYVKTFENVAAGKYTVTETNTTIAGYKFDSEASNTTAEATVSKTAEGVAKIKDVYEEEQKPGKLVIEKSVGGDVSKEEFEAGAISFVVSTKVTEDGKEVTKYLKSDGTLSDAEADGTYVIGKAGDGFETADGGKTYTKTFENVPAGSYTVNEKNSAVPGYDLVAAQSDTGDKTATIAKGGTDTAAFRDYYEEKPGILEIKKTIGGGVKESEVNNGSITFEVTTKVTEDGKEVTKWLDKEGKLQNKETLITLGAADGFEANEDATVWTKTFTSVPAGTYTVTEKNTELVGYTFNEDDSTTEATATVTAGAAKVTDESTAELTDEYEKKKGDLVIRKTVGGDVTKEEVEKAALKFEVKTSDGKWLDKDGNVSETKVELTLGSKDGFTTSDGGKTWTKTFKDVAPGKYTVTETNALIDGYVLKDSSKTNDYAEVEDGDKATAELTDEYEAIHFRVNKVDAGNGEELDGAKLVLYEADDNGVPMRVVDSWISKKGVLHDFGSKMTAGKTYVLREINAPKGYDKITTDIVISVEKDGSISCDLNESVDENGNIVYLVENSLSKTPGSDKDKDKAKGVKTGDETPIGEWLAVMAAAMSGLAATIYTRRRREDDVE